MKTGLNDDEMEKIRAALEAVPAVEKAVLFGSRAMGLARSNSDVDILLYGRALTTQDVLRVASLLDATTLPYQFDLIRHDVNNASLLEHVREHGKVIFQRQEMVSRSKPNRKNLGMASELSRCPLEECLDTLIDYRGKTPQKTNSGIPLITAKVVKSGRIEHPTEFIAKGDYNAWMTRGFPEIGDVVLTTEAPLGEVAQIKFLPVALAQRIILLRGKKEILDNRYLLYLLQSGEMQERLIGRSSGTTVIGIKQSELRKIEISLPRIEEQRAIAHILGTLDDKIELNRRMNEALEAMARALFKAWFVDFEPVRAKLTGRWRRGQSLPGLPAHLYDLFPDRLVESELGEIPEGWANGSLSSLASFQNGYAFKTKDWTDYGYPVVKIGNVKPGIIDFAGCSYVSKMTIENLGAFALQKGDLLVGMTGYVGETGLVPEYETTAYLNQRVGRISTKNDITDLGFVLCAVRDPMYKIFAESKAHGSAQANVSGKDLMNYPMVIPRDQILRVFNEKIFSFIMIMLANHEENQRISTIRDVLLPKLMTREIEVSHA